jgi:hypothetical protein
MKHCQSAFWIKLLADAGIMKKERLADLLKEGQELTAIFTVSRQTAKQTVRQGKSTSDEQE